jgi:Histidine kinase
MPRIWVWLQLIIGWLPVWALYSTLLFFAHPGTPAASAIFAGLRAIAMAALLGLVVHRLTERYRWPIPMRATFAAGHLVAAVAFSACWLFLTSVVEIGFIVGHGGQLALATRAPLIPFLVLGIWMYTMVAGISYSMLAAQRAAHAESLAATSQLAALRAQLNPHFLFNALHTVVQLIPHEPAQATQAAERLAGLLRTSLEEERDLIPLAEEWSFVQRYLELEQVRFGDRLQTEVHMTDEALEALVPSFALQTLVENAVRHGAAPRVEPTTVRIQASVADDVLTIDVQDDGAGRDPAPPGGGTGLSRLRDRLGVLFGERATLVVQATVGRGFRSTVTAPRRES